MPGPDLPISGGCMCGAVQFEISELIRSFDPHDGGWIKSFCGECGGQLYTRSFEDPDIVAVRMGALDEDPGIRPSAHQYVTYAAPWSPVPDDGLPRFRERIAATEPLGKETGEG